MFEKALHSLHYIATYIEIMGPLKRHVRWENEMYKSKIHNFRSLMEYKDEMFR